MNCPKCGTSNNVDSKFCIKCGQILSDEQIPIEQPVQQSSFQEEPTQNIDNTLIENENNLQTTATLTPNMTTSSNSDVPTAKVSFVGYFFIILAVILKPFTAFKEELNKFNGFKNSAFMSLILSGVATLAKLIVSMLDVVRVKDFDWSSGGYKTTWTWGNLKKIDYLEVIGKNFLIYLGIIAAIAVVYYIASLIIKKQPNFSRLLGISALSVAPMLICSLVLSPLLSLIWGELAIPIIFVSAVYTIILLYEGMNSEILLDGNAKYYFNLVCFSILGIIVYYLYMKLLTSSLISGLVYIMDLFG